MTKPTASWYMVHTAATRVAIEVERRLTANLAGPFRKYRRSCRFRSVIPSSPSCQHHSPIPDHGDSPAPCYDPSNPQNILFGQQAERPMRITVRLHRRKTRTTTRAHRVSLRRSNLHAPWLCYVEHHASDRIICRDYGPLACNMCSSAHLFVTATLRLPVAPAL